MSASEDQFTIEVEPRGQGDFWFACVDIAVIKDKELSPSDKAVYGVVCAHVNVQTRSCPLKVKTIAMESGCSERTVQESIKHLLERGVILRVERFINGKQKASVYRIVGHRAACYTEAKPMGADSAPVGVQKTTPRVQEPEPYENKTYLPTEGGDTEPVSRSVDLSEIPTAMRQVAEYLLLKTGRKSISPDELPAIRMLDRLHTPARVNQEISVAIARFTKLGRDPASLSFEYLLDSLKHQTSGTAKKAQRPRASPSADAAEKKRREKELDWEREQQREIERRFGGETDDPNTGNERRTGLRPI